MPFSPLSLSTEAPSLEEYLGDGVLRALTETFSDELEYVGAQRWNYAGNWKLFSENMYDGYHARVLHKALKFIGITGAEGGFQDPGKGRPHALSYNIGGNPPTGLRDVLKDPSVFEVLTKDRDEEGRFSNWLVNVFPSGVFMSNWDLITIRRVQPLCPTRSELTFAYYVPKDDSEDIRAHRIRKASNTYGPYGLISLEDTVVFERTQRSVVARGTHNILKGSYRQNPPYRRGDEAHMRAFYSAYRSLMEPTTSECDNE